MDRSNFLDVPPGSATDSRRVAASGASRTREEEVYYLFEESSKMAPQEGRT